MAVAGGRGLALLGHDLDLGQQCLHQLFRFHLPDQLAFFEQDPVAFPAGDADVGFLALADPVEGKEADIGIDRKSTRLNSSHLVISYAVFCLKKKTQASTMTVPS